MRWRSRKLSRIWLLVGFGSQIRVERVSRSNVSMSRSRGSIVYTPLLLKKQFEGLATRRVNLRRP